MKRILELRFTLNEFGKVVRDAPFLVYDGHEAVCYEDEPNVLTQIDDSVQKAYFEAEKKPDGDWRFGCRVLEDAWLRQKGLVTVN